jgi:hypothetical protein
MIKSRIMRWAGHVARVGDSEEYAGLLWGELRERNHLEDLGVDGKIIVKWICKKWDRED